MIDSGATISFIHQNLAKQYNLPLAQQRLDVSLADGSLHTSQHATRLVMQTSPDHFELQSFQLISLGNYSLILGMDWLRAHNPSIDWINRTVSLSCSTHHNLSNLPPLAKSTMPPTINTFDNQTRSCTPPLTPKLTSTKTTTSSIKPPMQPKNPSLINIAIVSNASFCQILKQKQGVGYMMDISQIHELSAATIGGEPDSPEIQLPEKYAEYSKVFSKAQADQLPPHRPYDHAIPVTEGATVPFGPVYNLSQTELKALHEYIKENLAKGFIRRSESPAGAPILFVKKKDGSLRLCVDYRGLNKVTTPNRCPLPLISETFDQLGRAKYFTKLDMRGAYNLLRIAKGDEWKTAFRCRYGHFEYQVMPFGLMNAPGTFQAFVNDVLRDYLDDFVVVYLDDILIYSDTLEEHTEHVRRVLKKLDAAGIGLKLEKCAFDKQEVHFLGFVIGINGISMDPAKVAAIQDWATPKSVFDIQVFLGLANFYRRFVRNYSKIAIPLTTLLKKNTKFVWSKSAQSAFDELKARLMSGPILRHFDPTKACVIEADASDYALGGVCSQHDEFGQLHPIAYYSRKLLPAEMNYQIYDKELLAIVCAFKHWRHYLEFSSSTTQVLTDHRNLEYFTTTRNLSRRQVRWSEVLSDFNFIIKYRPGSQNAAADSLSRRDKPEGGGATPLDKTAMTLLPPIQFLHNLRALPLVPENSTIQEKIRTLLPVDPIFGPIFIKISGNADPEKIYSVQDGLLLQEGLVCVPDDPELKRMILEECHDSPTAGHFGITKTLDLVSRTFYWPSMQKYIKDYVGGCDICQRSKSSNHKPYGLLQPLPIPERPWSSISVDFITQLPESKGYTAICVFVDRFTKMAHFAPTMDSIDAEGTVQLFFEKVFSAHGLPEDVVSDRGTTFTAKFTKSIFKALSIEQNLSTAFHPRTDGQTERVNSILEQYLRCYIDYQQTNWSTLLPVAEFAYNNTVHSSTKVTPFFANLGYHPRFSVTIPRVSKDNVPVTDRIQAFKDLYTEMKINIQSANDRHAKHFNTKSLPQPDLHVGEEVWLDARNLRTSRPARKLDYKRVGPFRVLEKVGTRSYRLDLPKTMKIHPVFHVSLLERRRPDPIPGRAPSNPGPLVVAGEDEFEVESVLDSKLERGKLFYFVHWKDYPISARTWEPVEFVQNSPQLLSKFHRTHPRKPGPLLRGAQP
jgi:RNase H-like domain found in reverse transcriptase/Reverse transcriptase (RNA-dependent DNA polymerase)/Integrase zinc binding domain/Chromo (CHRromatin Organisation MOdifier) domain/Retroviral aspartyl protease